MNSVSNNKPKETVTKEITKNKHVWIHETHEHVGSTDDVHDTYKHNRNDAKNTHWLVRKNAGFVEMGSFFALLIACAV